MKYKLLTHNESLKSWIDKFPERPLIEYHRNFSYINVSDRTKEQLAYLTEPLIIDGNPVNQWYFVSPNSDTPEWLELFQTGEITKNFEEVSPYLRERT